jgi:hypothetical protein
MAHVRSAEIIAYARGKLFWYIGHEVVDKLLFRANPHLPLRV